MVGASFLGGDTGAGGNSSQSFSCPGSTNGDERHDKRGLEAKVRERSHWVEMFTG